MHSPTDPVLIRHLSHSVAVGRHTLVADFPRKSNTCFHWGVRAPFRFPQDLLALERAWLAAYADLAQAPATAGTTAQRRRLITLSRRLCTHPYWETPADWRAGGDELGRAARTPAPAERNAA